MVENTKISLDILKKFPFAAGCARKIAHFFKVMVTSHQISTKYTSFLCILAFIYP